jgi:pantoate--beta-alanine ligase
MKIVHSIEQMRALRREAASQGLTVGLVPTMGALHEGHLSLVRQARSRAQLVVVSIFVNPLQFGPNEDYSRYPRTLEADCALLETAGADTVFAPSSDEMYPPGATTIVEVEDLGKKLDGRSRPTHFRGVATIVSKLFHIVQPTCAVFGQKDAAQVAVLRRMVRDLNMDIELIVGAIVREADGLALSSRNAYLTPEQRRQGLVLQRALGELDRLAASGESRAERLRECALRVLQAEPGAKLDYLEIVDPDTLDPVAETSHGALVAVAAAFGATRLIDNLLLPAR